MKQKQIGTYMLTVSGVFYIGSSLDIYQRRCSHISDLRHNKHPNRNLQKAWNRSPEQYKFEIIHDFTNVYNSDRNTTKQQIMDLEQKLLDKYAKDKNLANHSLNSRYPTSRPDLAKKWQNKDFREKMLNVIKNRPPLKAVTREIMSLKKMGSKNPKSKSLVVTYPSGESTEFGSVSLAAKHLKVSQQALDLWVRGKMNLPTSQSKTRHPQMIGIKLEQK